MDHNEILSGNKHDNNKSSISSTFRFVFHNIDTFYLLPNLALALSVNKQQNIKLEEHSVVDYGYLMSDLFVQNLHACMHPLHLAHGVLS